MKTTPYHLKSVGILCLLYSLFCCQTVKAEYLKHLDSGLKAQVIAMTSDSAGNLYIASRNASKDSLKISFWSIANRQWSNLTVKKGTYDFNSSGSSIAMTFYRGYLYLQFRASYGANQSEMWRYNGTWSFVANIYVGTYDNLPQFKIFKNYLYLNGKFSGLSTGSFSQLARFNGSAFDAGNYVSNGAADESQLDVDADTLFYLHNNSIFTHQVSGTWTKRYTHRRRISDFCVVNGLVYLYDQVKIYTMQGTVLVDSSQKILESMTMRRFKDQVFLLANRSTYDWSDKVFSYTNGGVMPYFYNTAPDSVGFKMYNANDQQFYFVSGYQVLVNGINYHHIVEVMVDSLKQAAMDTVLFRVYLDVNKNGKKDGSDRALSAYLYEKTLPFYSYIDSASNFELYLFDSEDLIFQLYGGNWPNACYYNAFPGDKRSKASHSPLSRDTIDFSFVDDTSKRNISVTAFATPRVRRTDSCILTINVNHQDCNSYTYNATLTIELNDSTVLGSASKAYSNKTGNVLTYQLNNQSSGSVYQIKLKLIYPFGNFAINDRLVHRLTLKANFAEDSSDNKDSVLQKIVSSYDPNTKYSMPEGRVNMKMNRIRYHIQFQNEGNDYAKKVTVVDTLNLKIPVYEFRMVGSSHNYEISYRGNIITWTFDNINLSTKDQDEAASKGYLIFDAMINGDIRVGDSILNRADIYFDYNDPIQTNIASIVRTDKQSSIEKTALISGIQLYPNPGSGHYTIQNSGSMAKQVEVLDGFGRVIETISLDSHTEKSIDLSHFASGLYILRIEGHTYLKFLKV